MDEDVLLDVSIENGKYRYVQTRTRSYICRYDEIWQDVTGNKMIYCVFAEVDSLRREIASLETSEGGAA